MTPATALASARQSAERKGKPGWRFTLQAPDYFAVMTYLANASIRRTMYEAYAVRATEDARDNRPVLGRILELRRAKAKLLGVPCYELFGGKIRDRIRVYWSHCATWRINHPSWYKPSIESLDGVRAIGRDQSEPPSSEKMNGASAPIRF